MRDTISGWHGYSLDLACMVGFASPDEPVATRNEPSVSGR
jgi:hypothetical protein